MAPSALLTRASCADTHTRLLPGSWILDSGSWLFTDYGPTGLQITDYSNVSSLNTRLGSSILLPRELCLPDSYTKSNRASLRREQEARAELLDSWPTR